MQARLVTCHRVNTFKWVDPEHIESTSCSMKEKPAGIRACTASLCDAEYRWDAGPWSEVWGVSWLIFYNIRVTVFMDCLWEERQAEKKGSLQA